MTKTQLRALKEVRKRLDYADPSCQASDSVKKALAKANEMNYLSTWVFPLIDALIQDRARHQLEAML